MAKKFYTSDDFPRYDEMDKTNITICKTTNKPNQKLNHKITLITQTGIDTGKCCFEVIVNAASTSMQSGGGVCGAIFDADDTNYLTKYINYEVSPVEKKYFGQFRASPGFKLPCKEIIHVNGPSPFHDPNQKENYYKERLIRSYKNCLDYCYKCNYHEILMCCISTSLYGYDPKKGRDIALETCREWLLEHDDYDMNIVFNLYGKNEQKYYFEKIYEYFPF